MKLSRTIDVNMALLKSSLLVLVCVVAAIATPFENCDPTVPALSLDVAGCDVSPCVFVRGQTFAANITFTVDHEVTMLGASLTIRVDNFPDQTLPLPAGCDNIFGGCPLEPEAINTYGIELPVASSGYEGPFTAEFSLIDEHDHSVVCVSVDGVLSAQA